MILYRCDNCGYELASANPAHRIHRNCPAMPGEDCRFVAIGPAPARKLRRPKVTRRCPTGRCRRRAER